MCQDAAADTHQSYGWPENIKQADCCDLYSKDYFHAQASSAGFLTLQLLLRAGKEDLVSYTRWERSLYLRTTNRSRVRRSTHA